MSQCYKLQTDISIYKEIPLDIEDIAEQLDADDRILDFLYLGVKDKRLKDSWGKVTTAFAHSPVYPEAVKIPSIFVWAGSCLIFSEKAHAVFRLMLDEYGEFLPIDVSGFTYYIFNNLTDVEPDLTRSYYDDERTKKVGALKFTDSTSEMLLFRSAWEGCTASFCNEKFRLLCIEYELDGLIFNDNLLDEGYLLPAKTD